MRWDRACDCSTVSSAQRPAADREEPDFVIRYHDGKAHAFNRFHYDRAQRIHFKRVYDHDDWRPVNPKGAVDMLADLVNPA